ncbi:MAG: lytic transglycosylase, partial [Pseudomonadota bacterium]
MKHWLWLLSIFSALGLAAPGDNQVLAAHDAFRHGERVKLGRQLDALRGLGSPHELQPWVEYWQLSQRLEEEVDAGVSAYLTRQAGSYLAEKLRGEWLKLLGKQQQWSEFQREYALLAQPNQELLCYALQSRLAVQQDPAALGAARPLWFATLDLPGSCMPLMEQMIAAERIGADDIWKRLRRLLEEKKLVPARHTAAYLPADQRPAAKTLNAIAERPLLYLETLPAKFASTRLGREMALYAVQRLARSDAAGAAARWQKIQDSFSDSERGYAWGQLAWQAARSHLPEALAWYGLADQARDLPLSEEQLAWRVRAALRAHDWTEVKRTIEQMPPQMSAQPDWNYWLARALSAHGRHEEARLLYLKIGGQPNFYSNLADDELNRLVALPPRAAAPTKEELAAARDNPGLMRALELYRLDLRSEGMNEWNWSLRGMDDRQLLAAANLALASEVYDRAINTANHTQLQHDYAIRYLAPFRDSVQSQANGMALDSGWVYG